jgi:drug/metabolite transporter (DMT)-like permease
LLLFLLPLGGLLGLVAGTCLERQRRPSLGLLDALCVQCVVSGVLFVSTTLTLGQMTIPQEPSFYAAALWLVVLSTGGGWGLYLVNLRLTGATRISSLLYLVPPTTMLLAFVGFHETIGPLALGGMAVCAVAVLLIRLRDPQQAVK